MTNLSQMTKTEALASATRACGSVYRVAASRQSGVTYGFNIRTDRGTRIAECGADYQDARRQRAAHIAEMVEDMLAPVFTAEEMNAAFAAA